MSYRIMRFRKYADSLRTNMPFFNACFKQKMQITANIIRFFISNLSKPLVVKNKPVTAQIEPTSFCNLKCEMCIRDKIGVPIGQMKFEDFRKILEKLDSLFKIHLSGQGEPFMNPELFNMIEYANKRGILVNINTNGTLMNENIIKKISGVDIGELAVSIDSTNKQKYEKIRKDAKFETLKKNVKLLADELKRSRKRTILSIATTIMADNIDEIPRFVELAKELGASKIIFQTLQSKEDYVKNYNPKIKKNIVKDFKSELNNRMKEAQKRADEEGISVIFDEEKSMGCLWPWRGIYITWNGYVTVCCKIVDYKSPVMGNIIKEDFWKIWGGRHYQIFRKMLRERQTPLACKGCSMV